MDHLPSSAMDEPGTFQIRVCGQLTPDWVEMIWGGVVIETDPSAGEPEMVLLGHVDDQAALIGLINSLYNMGGAVVSVQRVAPPEGDQAESDAPGEPGAPV